MSPVEDSAVMPGLDSAPLPVPWRRVASLLRPIRRGLAGMVSLSVFGSLTGLVSPLALGFLVNTLVEYGDKREAALWALAIVGAILTEAAAYVASDLLYARNAAALYRDLRMQMFAGARRRLLAGEEEAGGLTSRFVSDAETLERVTVGALDSGSMLLVELVAAVIALGLLEPVTVGAAAALLAVTTLLARLMQAPTVPAGQHRQEELEGMSRTLARELAGSDDPHASAARFRAAAERLLRAEVRLGLLSAVNRHGSGALAAIGPIAIVTVAAFAGNYRAGTLLSLYLLSGRVFYGFDGLVDLALSMQMVRGAIRRCFQLIDTPEPGNGARAGSA
jgi:ABC-type multidrug transport system fused ATPase/permease subunit